MSGPGAELLTVQCVAAIRTAMALLKSPENGARGQVYGLVGRHKMANIILCLRRERHTSAAWQRSVSVCETQAPMPLWRAWATTAVST